MWTPSPDEWGRIEPLVDQLLELTPSERGAFIERTFPSSPELRAWAQRLADGADDDGWLAQVEPGLVSAALASNDAPPSPADHPASRHGEPFGPFRIVRELGRGGMGQVFLAEREGGTFSQRVALKVVSAPVVSEAVRRRFLAEQQALARLEHPNVARLVDGGVRPDGIPWLAMEYVDGMRIDEWCDAKRLEVPARLRLFLQVCDAVQAAHQRLVIHRDLKPSNILVTADGSVRLLDFGVAKLMEANVGDEELTRGGDRMFTPGYAAPEQWRLEPTTTATDCFALGVILYLLLSGARPYSLRDAAPRDWLRALEEETPRSPSAMVSDESAAARGTTRERLRRTLEGDLDAIVLSALRADASRRYPTARQFADDITRYLSGIPVSAREDAWTYRASRFLKRNRLAVASSAIVVLAIGAGAVATAWQARRATRAAEEATAVSSFLAGIFREASPLQTRGDSLTAGEMLQRAAVGIDSMFPDRPELRVRLLLTVAEINRDLAAFGRADTLARRAAAVADSFSTRTLHMVAAQSLLADIARARGELPLADSLMRGALTLARELNAPDTTMARLYGARGHVLYRQQKYSEAEAAYRAATTLGTSLGALFVGSTTGNLAVALDDGGRDAEADALYARSLAIYRSADLGTHPDYLQALGNSATQFQERWELDSAQALQAELVPLLWRIYPDGHDRVVIALNNLSFTRLMAGKLVVAESGFAEANALAVRLHNPTHLLALTPLNNVGRARLAANKAAAAESTYRSSLGHVRAGIGGKHPLASVVWLGLGRAFGAQGRHEPALAAFDSADAIAAAALPPTHPRHAEVALARAEVLLATGRFAEAERLARRSLVWRREHLAARDPGVADAAFVLARAIAAQDTPATLTPARRAEVDSLGTEAVGRYARIPSRADRRAAVDSAMVRWRDRWRRSAAP